MFEPVLVKLEKSKPHGADHVRTVPTSSDSGRRHLARRPLFPPPQAPPRAAIRGAPHRRAPSFCPLPSLMPCLFFSSCRADRHTPVHRAPPPPASLYPTAASLSSTPRWCTSTTLPASAPTTPSAPHCRSSPLDARRHGQSATASLRLSRPHPEHRAAEYFLPKCSDPASDPYSGLPASFPRRRSPPLRTSLPGELLPPRRPKNDPPPYRLAPWTLPATPHPRHRRNSAGPPSTGAMGASFPASRSWARWPSGPGTPGRAGLAGTVGQAHYYSGILQLPFE
jgi:hypothetical protein